MAKYTVFLREGEIGISEIDPLDGSCEFPGFPLATFTNSYDEVVAQKDALLYAQGVALNSSVKLSPNVLMGFTIRLRRQEEQ